MGFKFNDFGSKSPHAKKQPIGEAVRQHGNFTLKAVGKERPSLRIHQNGLAIPDSADRHIEPSKGVSKWKRGWHWQPPIAGAKRVVVETVSRAGHHAPIVHVEEEFEENPDKRMDNMIAEYEEKIARYGDTPQS